MNAKMDIPKNKWRSTGEEGTYTAMDTLKKIENNDMNIRRLYYLAPL